MYRRRKTNPALKIILAAILLAGVIYLLGRLDFPGWVMRGLSGIFPRSSQPAYTPEEVEEIRERVGTLEAENTILRNMIRDIQEEAGLAKQEIKIGYELLPAQVIYRDHARIFQTIIINRGTFDGVEAGMPVIDTNGVVGRVVSTRAAVSRVELITSPNCAFGVIDLRSREIGVVSGSKPVKWELGKIDSDDRNAYNPSILVFDYISPSADISVNDTLVTSGLSAITPPGLRVGEVFEIILREEQGWFDIRVRPYADIEHLSTVAVVLCKAGYRADIESLLHEIGEEITEPERESQP